MWHQDFTERSPLFVSRQYWPYQERNGSTVGAFAIERCKESNQNCLSVLSSVTSHPGLAKSRGFAIADPSAPLPPLYTVTLVGNCLGVRAEHIYGQPVQMAGPCENTIETVKLSRAAPL